MRFSRRSLLALPVLGACSRKRGTGFRGSAIVAVEASRAAVFVDLTAFAVRATVPLEAAPSGLINNQDLGVVYALTAGPVQEIDVRRHAAARKAALRGTPVAMQLDGEGKRLWVLSKAQDALTPIETDRFAPGKPVNLSAAPVDFDLSPKAPLAAITYTDGSVALADLSRGAVQSRIALATNLGGVLFRSDGRVVLVADRGNRMIVVLDTASWKVVAQLPLALRPDHLCMKPDGGQLFITGEGRDGIAIVYPYRTEVAQTALSGRAPGAMGCSTNPDLLFVANPAAGSVTIFSTDTQRVLAVTAVGKDPCDIVITPDQQYALVVNRGSGDMAVIRIAAIQAGRNKSAPLFTMVPVGAQPVNAIVRPA